MHGQLRPGLPPRVQVLRRRQQAAGRRSDGDRHDSVRRGLVAAAGLAGVRSRALAGCEGIIACYLYRRDNE